MAAGPLGKTASVRTTTASTNLAKLLQDIFLAKKFVPFLRKNLVVCQFGDEEDLPAHSGKNVRWLFHNALSTSTPLTALGEGDDPSDSTATVVNFIEAAMGTYGAFIEFTEELEDYAHPETMSQFSELLGQQGAEVFDTLVQTGIGAANGLDSTTTTVGTSNPTMTVDLLRQATGKLRTNSALPHPKAARGFAAILSPNSADNMYGEGNPTWWQLKTAATPGPSINPMNRPGVTGEGGPRPEVEGIANATIYVSTNVVADSNSPVNDLNLVLAANCFGISSFETNYMKPTVRLVEPVPSLASPLGRRGLYIWKGKFTTKLFDSKRACLIPVNQ